MDGRQNKLSFLIKEMHFSIFSIDKIDLIKSYVQHLKILIYLHSNIFEAIYERMVEENIDDQVSIEGRLFMDLTFNDTKFKIKIKRDDLPKINYTAITEDENVQKVLSELITFFPFYSKHDEKKILEFSRAVIEHEFIYEKEFNTSSILDLEKILDEIELPNDKHGKKKLKLKEFIINAICLPLQQIIINAIVSFYKEKEIKWREVLKKHESGKAILLQKQYAEREALENKQLEEIQPFLNYINTSANPYKSNQKPKLTVSIFNNAHDTQRNSSPRKTKDLKL